MGKRRNMREGEEAREHSEEVREVQHSSVGPERRRKARLWKMILA